MPGTWDWELIVLCPTWLLSTIYPANHLLQTFEFVIIQADVTAGVFSLHVRSGFLEVRGLFFQFVHQRLTIRFLEPTFK